MGFVNYTAHGYHQEWSDPQFTNSNVNQLTNTNKYFLAMGNCCLSGNFGYSGGPCYGEAMIRAENKAAYSYIGSCPNTYWYEDYYFGVGATNTFSSTPNINNTATGVYDAVWMDDTYNTVSSMTFLGNIAVCYAYAGNYSNSSSSGCSPTYYWQAYHVLGDGSIMPYRVNPTANVVNHANTFPAGATSFQVSAQEGSYVAISQNNVLKGTALVPASGTVSVPVSGITAGQQVRIVVTKPQRQPYIQDISVASSVTQYTVSVSANPTEGGTVDGGGTFNQGTSCTVSASANEGYDFVNWTENGNTVSTNANFTFNVTANRNLVANFEQQIQTYTITATANPTNGGTVTGAGTYNQDESCTLTATPAAGYTFVKWTKNGTQVSTNPSYTFTVTESASYVAHFQMQSFTITASANPTNGGSVTGGGTYNYNASCTLKATPAMGYNFVKWTKNGAQVSTNANYTFTVTESAAFVAHFEQQSYTIIATANPTEGGSITGAGTYTYGQSCSLTATPATGYDFVNWTENGNSVSTNANFGFPVTSNRTLVANFELKTIDITVVVNPEEGGTAIGAGTYNYGEEVTVTVSRNEDWAFINWTENGNVVSEEETLTFVATESRTLVANLDYTVGIGEQGGMALFMYPNPVGDLLTVEAQETIEKVEVYNIVGALVLSQTCNANKVEIGTAELPAGTYIIRLTTNNGLRANRFVKE